MWIPSKYSSSRQEVAATYRSDSGREDIYLDIYQKGTGKYLFTSATYNFYVSDNACHNSNYVMEVSFNDPRLRTIWMRATGESILNVYVATPGASNWMKGLDSSLSISQISIPGTHDSGAFDSSRACECQSNDPVQQLETGVRSFDFRITCDGDDVILVHGDIQGFGCNFNFSHIVRNYLEGFRSFLHDHPTETIIIHMMKESDPLRFCSDTVPNMLDALMSTMEAEGLVILKDYDKFPTLEEARGKVLIWHDPNLKPSCNYPIELTWNSDTSREVVTWGSSGARFVVQDAYKNNSSAKWDIVKNILNEASSNTDPLALYYNYTSCVAGGSPNPAGEAENINEWFAAWLSRNPDIGPLGCVIMDYINCSSFSGTGVTWYCNSGSHDLLPFMIYASNY